MLLSEDYKKRMMELAGVKPEGNLILEVDKRNVIINKLKIPKEIADWAHNIGGQDGKSISEKYSVWIASSLKQKFFEDFNNRNLPSADIKDVMETWALPKLSDANTPNQKIWSSNIQEFVRNFTGDYQNILDWLKGRTTLAPEHDVLNFKTLTFDEAKQRSEIWHKKLAEIQGGKIEDEDGDVVLTFLDGFYWIRLNRDYCEKEAEAMGHCGRASGSVLYSLRKDQYPYVTAAVREEDGVCTQMKGRGNTKPKSDFHRYIIPFILGNKPDIKYFYSRYRPETDFNINDLNDTDFKNVVHKKPSLLGGNGVIAMERLPYDEFKKHLTPELISELDGLKVVLNKLNEKDLMVLLLHTPQYFDNLKGLPLSDLLKTPEMVTWALQNKPELFTKNTNYGSIVLTEEQLKMVLGNAKLAGNLNIDRLQVDDNTLRWIVKTNPVILENTIVAISRLTEEEKDYLVTNHPNVFKTFVYNQINERASSANSVILKVLGKERLQKLFVSHPEFFKTEDMTSALYLVFLTPELISWYIKSHNKDNDPFGVFTHKSGLERLSNFITFDEKTLMYLLVYHPDTFYVQLINYIDKGDDTAAKLGRYIIDNHFEWIEDLIAKSGNYHYNRSLPHIYDWDLSPAQKQKIVDFDLKNEGDTQIIPSYNSEELESLALSPEQINQLLEGEETENFTVDMLIGFNVPKEKAKEPLLNLLLNNPEEDKKITKQIEDDYPDGANFLRELYNENPKAFPALIFAVKYKDVKRLKQYNSNEIIYGDNDITLLASDWSSDDITNLFDDPKHAEQVANYDLNFTNYNYSFDDISGNLDDLSKVNMARIKYLLIKAFGTKYKIQINAMSDRDIGNLLEDPEDFFSENEEQELGDFNNEIIDEIKEAFIRATEDAQRNADEGEYFELFSKPVEDLFSEMKFENHKIKKYNKETKEYEIKDENVLAFHISYEEYYKFIKDAEEQNSNNADDEYTLAIGNGDWSIIRMALAERGEELKIDEPYYGVQGDINKEDLNERFSEHIYHASESANFLKNAKIVVKRNPKTNKPQIATSRD